MKAIDLNVDIAEGFPFDEELLQFATSANICLGQHAGSWDLTRRTVDKCVALGVRVGAHPGFPDRESMGRRVVSSDWIAKVWPAILERFEEFVSLGVHSYVKPHGAFYNMLAESSAADQALSELMALSPGSALMGLPATRHESLALASGWTFIREGFADRGYRSDGTLIPRSEPGAILEDQDSIGLQILQLAPRVDSICLHGDTSGCVKFARFVRGALVDAGYEVRAD